MPRRSRKSALLIAVLLLSLPVALYLRLAPVRAENDLKSADVTGLAEAVRRDPTNGRAFYHYGLRQYAMGRLGAAQPALNRAAELSPDDADIAAARVALAQELGDAAGAQAVVAAWRKDHSEPPPTALTPLDAAARAAVLRDADQAVRQGDDAEAIHAYRWTLARNPDCAEAYEGLGRVYDAQGDIANAFAALQKALELNPRLRDAQYLLAHQYVLAGLKDVARRRLESLVAQTPENPVYLNALGLCLQDQYGDYPKAEEAFARAVALAPQNVAYRINRARMEIMSDKPEACEKTLRDALQIAPDSAAVKGALGAFLAKQKPDPAARAEAETLLRDAARADPSNLRVSLALARLLVTRGRVADAQEAVPLLQKVIAAQPTADAYYQMSRACQRIGDGAEASRYRALFHERSELDRNTTDTLEQAQADPKRPDLRLKLARLYARYGDYAKSLNQYQVYQRMRPDDTAAQKELDDLAARLTASGRMPPMEIFSQMVAAGGG